MEIFKRITSDLIQWKSNLFYIVAQAVPSVVQIGLLVTDMHAPVSNI